MNSQKSLILIVLALLFAQGAAALIGQLPQSLAISDTLEFAQFDEFEGEGESSGHSHPGLIAQRKALVPCSELILIGRIEPCECLGASADERPLVARAPPQTLS